MKTFVIGLFFLGFTNLMHSQNDIASVDVNLNEYVKPIKNNVINSSYLYSFDNKISSARVKKFQNLVANYDIKATAIYSNDEKSNYTVVFEEGENQIKAVYNQDGKIVQCTELFKGIRLPYTISSDIAKKYPGWEFSEISCHISYSQDKNEQVIYKVAIQNGNQKKTLKLNTADYSL